jgi:rSAM/selenodomain-associated transferase 2
VSPGPSAAAPAEGSIAVVIPTLNEAATLGALLGDLLGEEGDFSINVADGGSGDGTREVARRFPGIAWVRAPRGRAAQMNAGAAASRGDILLFLHADSRLPPDAFGRIRAALADPAVAAGSFCLGFDHDDPWLRAYARLSRLNHPLFTYGDQGLFLRRERFERIGGFRDLPLMEDVEIQRRLRRSGAFVKLRTPVVTSARRFLGRGVVRQQALNTGLVLLYHLGVAPHRLVRLYERSGPQGPP